MKKTKKKVQVLNNIQFAAIFDMDGTLFQTNKILGSSLERTFEILRSEGSWIEIPRLPRTKGLWASH